MVKDTVYRNYVVRLRPLTPVHVWSGKRLIVGLDVVKRGDKLCVVDLDRVPQEVVEKILAVKPEETHRIVESYSGVLPCREELGLNVRPSEGAYINEIASNLIPGSSLKGYIRTAILYMLLKNIKSTQSIRNVLSNTINLDEDPRNIAQGLEGYFFRTPRPRKQGGYVDSLQQLLISDPAILVSKDCLSVNEFQVFELPSMKRVASQYVMAVTCGELVYSVKMLRSPVSAGSIAPFVREHARVLERLSLLQKGDILLESLRIFGCDLVRYEVERSENIKELGQYKEVLRDLMKKYCDVHGDCVIAKLGYMAGLRSKTVIGVVRSADRDLYNSILYKMQQFVGRTWDELTIKLTKFDGKLVGVGWCELCVSS